MKKITFLIALLLFINRHAYSQSQLWGVSESGGSQNYGTIFMADSLGNNLHSVYSFDFTNGAVPVGGLTLAGNGKLYGVTLVGGFSGSCVIFCYNPSTGTSTDIHDFAAAPLDGDDAHSEMILANNGKMYGLCNYGGLYNKGAIFQLDTFNNYTDLLDFTDTTGAVAWGRLLQANNGLLYGMTSTGGVNNIGTIFSYNIATSAYAKLYDFTNATGNPGLIQATNGLLYGMTSMGGANGDGTIFSFNIATNAYTDLHDFNGTNGVYPMGTLLQAANGKLYGMTEQGGSGNGTIFSFNISTNTFSDLVHFNGTNGSQPRRSFTETNNGELFATTSQGGIYNLGVAFNFNTATNTFTKLIDFNDTITGGNPDCNFIKTPILLNCANGTILNVTSTSCTGYNLGSQTYYTSGTYTQVLTNIRGCDSLVTLHLSFGTLPVITVNSANICAGTSVTLTANGDTAYTWSAGATPTGVNTATVSPTVTTTYTVTSTTTGCSAVATVTVRPAPSLPYVWWSGGTETYCQGNSIDFIRQGGTEPNVTYLWEGPNGLSYSNNNTIDWNIPSLATSMSGMYYYTATAQNGCISRDTFAYLNVGQPPYIYFGGTQTICSGGIASFIPTIYPPIDTINWSCYIMWTVASSSPNISGYSYNYLNRGSIHQILTNSGTTAETVTYTIYAEDTDISICNGNTVTFTVTVYPKPRITVTANSPIICQAGIDTLVANGAVSYIWSAGATGFGIDSASVSPASTTSYTVTGTTAQGCTNTAVTTVAINPLPNVTVTSPSICLGDTATLTVSGAAAYSWSAGVTPTGINTAKVSPTVTTTYTVTGTTCGNSDSTTVTVFVNPIPNVGVYPPSIICAGATTTLLATGASTYIWSAGATSTGGGYATVTPIVTTTYTVTGTSVCGFSDSAMVTVTVNPLPVITVNSPTICRGNTTTLTVHGSSVYSCNWYPGGTTITGDSTAIASPYNTTTYTVTGYNAAYCSSTATSTVTVLPSPSITVNSPTICAGQTTALISAGGTTYTWSAGATATGVDTATANPIITTSYTVTGTAGSCSNTAVAIVTVNALPIVTVNSPAICEGKTANLVAGGASTYTWSADATSTGVNTATAAPVNTTTYTVIGTSGLCTASAISTVTVNPLPIVTATASSPTICLNAMERLNGGGASTYIWNNGIYNNSPFPISFQVNDTVTGTDIHGCIGTASITITLTPIPTVTAHVSSQTVCRGDSVVFTATGNAQSYTWNNGVTNGVPFVPVTSGSYIVTGTDANMCSSYSSVHVTVDTLPVITVNSPTICSGETATLMASGADSYTWSAGTTSIGVYTATVSPTSNSTYTVTGTNACGNDTAVASVTINNPDVSITNNGATITANATGATYQWLNCNTNYSIIAGASNQSYTPTADGNYAVIVNNGTCSDTSACVNITTLGINQLTMDNGEFTIYPNPASGAFTISTTGSKIKEVKVFDVVGRVIRNYELGIRNTVTIDMNGENKGIYFVEITDEKGIAVNRKIIIQ